MNNFFVGVSYLNAGFQLIMKPGVRRFVIIPVCINIIVFIGMFFLFQHYMQQFNHWIMLMLPTWLQWLSYIFWFVFLMGFLFFFIYAFIAIGNIISAPFNSFLSEKVETLLTGRLPPSRTMFENIKDIPRMIGRQFTIVGYYLLRVIVLLILLFIPIVHAIVPALWFLFSAWFMAMSYLDYPTDNHRVSIQQLRHWLSQRNWTTLGFGSSIVLVSMIPILNFFVIPAAVAGATQFWIEAQTSNQ